jgi:hypothetical protein
MDSRKRNGDASRRGGGPAYAQLLLFPERAEYLNQDQYENYRIRLDHWRELSSEFRRAFQAVYERKSASVLLVHGEQGTGKTLFTRKLEEGFETARRGIQTADPHNLWHVLSGGDPVALSLVREVTPRTVVRRVAPESEWLRKESEFAASDKQPMRVFIIDDVHKDVFLRELADLSQGDYLRLKADGKSDIALESVAQRIVESVRGNFARSLFVLLSNDRKVLDRLHAELERSHAGLSRVIALPLPDPPLKEEIVRTNTNGLNRRSYWYCLDQGGPKEKSDAFNTLTGTGGFIDSFQAIDRALSAGVSRRSGRPANKNLLTLVTLATEPLVIESFIADRDLQPNEVQKYTHIGAWLFREGWASVLGDDSNTGYARRAGLVESEFTLRWVALGVRATWCLCNEALTPNLDELIVRMPRIGEHQSVKVAADVTLRDLDTELDELDNTDVVDRFAAEFREAGQGRSRTYERAIAKRFSETPFGRSLTVYSSVKPDLTLSDYRPCAVTSSKTDDAKAIEEAIRRNCHVIEFTAHLQADMRGLVEYLREKVETYAQLLESV